MAWFISDTHFNHGSVIRYYNRPFKNSKEMDEAMIDLWNSTVAKDDIVFHLGDFAFGLRRDKYKELVNKLNGRIVLIQSRSDQLEVEELKSMGFEEVYGYEHAQKGMIVYNQAILTHKPLDENLIHKGFINIHGHIHNKDVGRYKSDKYLNVSTEAIGYKPMWIGVLPNRWN